MTTATLQRTVVNFPIDKKGIPIEQVEKGMILQSNAKELIIDVSYDLIRPGSVNVTTLSRSEDEEVRVWDSEIPRYKKVKVIKERGYFGVYANGRIVDLHANSCAVGIEGIATHFAQEDATLREAGL